MKVLSCVAKQSRDGQKTFYDTVLEKDGQQISATAFEPLKVGEVVEDSRLARNKNDDGWIIKSASRPKGSYQRNDDLATAQVSIKVVADLIIANKMNVADLNSDTCTKIALIIKRTAANITAPPAAPAGQPAATLAGQPPSAHSANPDRVPPPPITPDGPIKNMGDLRMRITKAYPTVRTVAAMDSILGKEPITDFDAAFQKVVAYMEKPI